MDGGLRRARFCKSGQRLILRLPHVQVLKYGVYDPEPGRAKVRMVGIVGLKAISKIADIVGGPSIPHTGPVPLPSWLLQLVFACSTLACGVIGQHYPLDYLDGALGKRQVIVLQAS